jgi:hypothetical protein
MTKCVPQDWHLRSIDDRLIGNFDKRQIVESDIAGEYFRMDNVANCFTDILEEQFKYWTQKGVCGISVRPDRWAHDHLNIVLNQPQEVNLWVLGHLASGKSDNTDEIWKKYSRKAFGEKAADIMTAALKPTGQVNAEALCVGNETFGDTRNSIPAINSMHKKCFVPMTDEEDEKNGLWLNPFHSNWSVFRWDKSYLPEYHKTRKGHPDVIRDKTAAYKNALSSADKSLELVETARRMLLPDAYEFYKFKLEENKFHLIAMCEIELAWLKSSNIAYYCTSSEEKAKITHEITEHLNILESLTVRYDENVECDLNGRRYILKRGSYLDIAGFVSEFKRFWGI